MPAIIDVCEDVSLNVSIKKIDYYLIAKILESQTSHGVMGFLFLLNFLVILASFDILVLLSVCRVFSVVF